MGKEYEQLRGSKLFSVSKKVVAGDADYVVYTGENGTTMDTEIDIVIPAGGFKSGTTSSDVTMSVSGGASTALPGTFTLLEGESSLPLRLMSDRRTIEVFAAGGRAVFSAPLSSASGAITVAVDAGSDIEFAATGWMMESIFHSDTSAQVV